MNILTGSISPRDFSRKQLRLSKIRRRKKLICQNLKIFALKHFLVNLNFISKDCIKRFEYFRERLTKSISPRDFSRKQLQLSRICHRKKLIYQNSKAFKTIIYFLKNDFINKTSFLSINLNFELY